MQTIDLYEAQSLRMSGIPRFRDQDRVYACPEEICGQEKLARLKDWRYLLPTLYRKEISERKHPFFEIGEMYAWWLHQCQRPACQERWSEFRDQVFDALKAYLVIEKETDIGLYHPLVLAE